MIVGKAPDYSEKSIVFFDGVCNFCNATVDWVWKKNKKENIYFSSLQSEFASNFLKERGIDTSDFSTIYFFEKGKLHKRSRGVFRIMGHFRGGLWLLGKILQIVPSFLADPFYRLIANNRYKLTGKRDTCRIPTAAEKSRFLE